MPGGTEQSREDLVIDRINEAGAFMVGTGKWLWWELLAFPDFNAAKNQIILSILSWSFGQLRRNSAGCVLYDPRSVCSPVWRLGSFKLKVPAAGMAGECWFSAPQIAQCPAWP